MSTLTAIKPAQKPRIGLYSIGLRAYWEQFPGLRERLIAYGQFIERRLSEWAEVSNFGLVDTEGTGREAGAWLQAKNVDLVFCHAAHLFYQLDRAAGSSDLQRAGRLSEPSADRTHQL